MRRNPGATGLGGDGLTPHSNLPGNERQQGDDDGSLFLILASFWNILLGFHALNEIGLP